MKTLEQIVDGLWKPKEPDYKYHIKKVTGHFVRNNIAIKDRHRFLHDCYVYQKLLHTPFYGYDVQEPVVKICKRILEKPNRFHLVKSFDTEQYTYFQQHRVKTGHGWKVIQDKDTGQKFIREKKTSCVTNPSFLTYDEKVLLTVVIDEWYNYMKESLAQKQIEIENKRKDKFRQEMIELYKGL